MRQQAFMESPLIAVVVCSHYPLCDISIVAQIQLAEKLDLMTRVNKKAMVVNGRTTRQMLL
jgi:hypothetical protein